MQLEFPWALLGLLAVPLLAAGYLLALRRRKRQAVVFSDVLLLRAARPTGGGRRRHLPVLLVLMALTLLGGAAARPQAVLDVPISESAVILAVDVSGSMCATDVEPNRLSAAQTAVREFVAAQDSRTRIGLVVFSGFAQLAVAPTTERDDVLQAIDSLTTGRGTTIGAAILKSVDAIAAIDPAVAPVDTSEADQSKPNGLDPNPSPSADAGGPSSGAPGGAAPAAPGSYAPEIVVLLTDGANTRGISPVDAAKQAAARGVRVYPIGFGTSNPTSLSCTAKQLGGNGFDGFRQGPTGGIGAGGANFLVADVPTLQQVATLTGGTYFSAGKAEELQRVLADLPRHVEVQQRRVEVTVALVGLAVLCLLGAGWAAVRWTPFPS